jgi:hypothetical protein
VAGLHKPNAVDAELESACGFNTFNTFPEMIFPGFRFCFHKFSTCTATPRPDSALRPELLGAREAGAPHPGNDDNYRYAAWSSTSRVVSSTWPSRIYMERCVGHHLGITERETRVNGNPPTRVK